MRPTLLEVAPTAAAWGSQGRLLIAFGVGAVLAVVAAMCTHHRTGFAPTDAWRGPAQNSWSPAVQAKPLSHPELAFAIQFRPPLA